jgi:hypothetical protein
MLFRASQPSPCTDPDINPLDKSVISDVDSLFVMVRWSRQGFELMPIRLCSTRFV